MSWDASEVKSGTSQILNAETFFKHHTSALQLQDIYILHIARPLVSLLSSCIRFPDRNLKRTCSGHGPSDAHAHALAPCCTCGNWMDSEQSSSRARVTISGRHACWGTQDAQVALA